MRKLVLALAVALLIGNFGCKKEKKPNPMAALAAAQALETFTTEKKVQACRMQIQEIAMAVTIHYADEGDYPDSLSDVSGIRETDVTDPWKNELRYNSSSTRGDSEVFDLCSDGPDEQQGTEDDICYRDE